MARAGYTVGLTASLPLYDGGQRRAEVDAAKARAARAQADALNVQELVERETASAWLTWQTATAQVQAANAGVSAAQQGYDLANLRYNAGKSTTAERLDALATLVRAQGAVAQAKARPRHGPRPVAGRHGAARPGAKITAKRYNHPTVTRRHTFPIVALLLALLIGTGATIPSSWLWQCHHSSRLVASPFAAPGAMPCHMRGQLAQGVMACCRAHRTLQTRSTDSQQTLSAPDCQPVFVELAAIPAAFLGQSHDLSGTLTGAYALLVPAGSVSPTLLAVTMRQRPPPAIDIPISDLLHVPGLRAPPSA